MVIKVNNLVKNYGITQVIKDISFAISEGEIFGVLGANGAGKTTTLECIEGIRKYNSGSIEVKGVVGVQLQSSSLPATIKVKEAIALFSKWNKRQHQAMKLEDYDLESIKERQYKQLSTGQKRKLHLALAMIGDPDIIFLDEPTAGLDVEHRSALHDKIRSLKKDGKTIIFASHDMAEIENLCDRIAVLKNGKIAFIGTIEAFTANRNDENNIRIKFAEPIKVSSIKESILTKEEQGYMVFSTQKINQALSEILRIAGDTDILDVTIEKSSLEQSFMKTVTEEIK